MAKKLGLERLAQCLEALGDPTRLAVYRVLVRAGKGGLPVGRIQERTGVPRSTLSHHLHRLIAVGLVSQERQGTTLICRVNYPAMRQVVLYSRRGCHLCDVAREVVLEVRETVDFGFLEIDIETDDELVREYGIRIPVVTVDGREAFETAVDAGELSALVRL